jgi:hypothetical protein
MTIDPSKNMDIDAILEDLYRSEINASILWASPGRGFHATLGSATLVGPIPGRQLRLLRCTGRADPAGPGSRMHTLDDGRPGVRTRKGDEVRLDRLTVRS